MVPGIQALTGFWGSDFGISFRLLRSLVFGRLGMFSAEQVREMSIEVDRQLAAARVMPIADEKDAMDEIRRLRSQLRVQKDYR